VEVKIPALIFLWNTLTVTTDLNGVATFRDPGLGDALQTARITVTAIIDGEEYEYQGEWPINVWGSWDPDIQQVVLAVPIPGEEPAYQDLLRTLSENAKWIAVAGAAIVILGPISERASKRNSGVY
jgi:hypothetical protein